MFIAPYLKSEVIKLALFQESELLTRKEENTHREKPQKQRTHQPMAAFLAACVSWQVSYSKAFELFQQISFLPSLYMTCVIVETS